MKSLFMIILVAAFTLPSFARTTSVTGHGQESGLCSAGPVGDSCIRNTRERAGNAGLRDADWVCQSKQGQSQLYTGRCNSSCYPTYIPPNNGPTTVRCNATCTLECDVSN